MNFEEWFNKKLVIGSFPFMVSEDFNPSDYKYCINVSDEFYSITENAIHATGCKTYWFPMNERKRDIGLNSIYGAIIILNQAEKENVSVYLHCHAGRNRSRIIQACYYFFRTGKQFSYGNEKYFNRIHQSVTRGYLPPMAEMEQFLTAMRNKMSENSNQTVSGILDECKMDINNF